VSFGGNDGKAFKKVAQALLENGFSVEHTDASIGALKVSTSFPIPRGIMGIEQSNKAVITVILKDDILKTNATYLCNYPSTSPLGTYSGSMIQGCWVGDKPADKAISELEIKIDSSVSQAIKTASETTKGNKPRK
jgi:hypothetical protein